MPIFDQKEIILSGMDSIFNTSILTNVFGIQWKQNTITEKRKFPQYFMQVADGKRIPVSESVVPSEYRRKIAAAVAKQQRLYGTH
jgi:hypothetical protein